jgi:hypothetical protein
VIWMGEAMREREWGGHGGPPVQGGRFPSTQFIGCRIRPDPRRIEVQLCRSFLEEGGDSIYDAALIRFGYVVEEGQPEEPRAEILGNRQVAFNIAELPAHR